MKACLSGACTAAVVNCCLCCGVCCSWQDRAFVKAPVADLLLPDDIVRGWIRESHPDASVMERLLQAVQQWEAEGGEQQVGVQQGQRARRAVWEQQLQQPQQHDNKGSCKHLATSLPGGPFTTVCTLIIQSNSTRRLFSWLQQQHFTSQHYIMVCSESPSTLCRMFLRWVAGWSAGLVSSDAHTQADLGAGSQHSHLWYT